MTPRKGIGQFQWNTGGWFGAQIGSTAYLVILGIACLFKWFLPGIIILLCGLIPNLIGYIIWRKRDRLAPYPAIQYLMITIFVFTAIAIGVSILYARAMNMDPLIIRETTKIVWVPLIYPALMLRFYFLENMGRKRNNAEYGHGS